MEVRSGESDEAGRDVDVRVRTNDGGSPSDGLPPPRR